MNSIKFYFIAFFCVAQFLVINAQQAPILRGKALIDLYNAGIAELQKNNIEAGMSLLRQVAQVRPATMDEYRAKISALENLIVYSRERNDTVGDMNYSFALVMMLDEAFQLASISKSANDQKFKEQLATILADILKKNGVYVNLAGRDRKITLTRDIDNFLESKKAAYFALVDQKQFQLIQTNDSLNLAAQAVLRFTAAVGFIEKIKKAERAQDQSLLEGFMMNQRANYKEAFDLFSAASNLRSDIPNVEYHLALMYLNGLGTTSNIYDARMHINQAFNNKKHAPADLMQKIDELKNEIDARFLSQDGFNSYSQALNKSLDAQTRLGLKQEAFNYLQQASTLYAKDFNVEIALAQMFFRGEGTPRDLTKAKTHAKLAKNMAVAESQKEYVAQLIEKIDQLAVELAQARTKATDYDYERARSRVFGNFGKSKASSSAQLSATQLEEEVEPEKEGTDWFVRLFGTTKPQPRINETGATASSSASAGSSSASSSTGGRKSVLGLGGLRF